MTNSTPSKLTKEYVTSQHIKANGIDTLIISLNGEWKNLEWFSYFASLKQEAQESSLDVSGTIKTENLEEWSFRIKPNGSQGFEWLLISNDFTLRIGKWATSKTRPNVMAELRSEMLWRLGPQTSCSYITTMLEAMGLDIAVVKPSRVDFCLDILLTKSLWNKELIEYVVTRASERSLYMQNAKQLKGLSIGKGDIMARLYDKALEIKQVSNKAWMYDVWGIDEIPQHKVMVRVEFQIRRAVLKDTHIETLSDLFEKQPKIWSYCTKEWLKFQDNVDAYRKKRKTLEWWKIIQDGYENAQGATPAIREHILKLNIEQLARQAYGLILSIAACHKEIKKEPLEKVELEDVLIIFLNCLTSMGKTPSEMNETIIQRRVKFKRLSQGTGE